MSPWQLLFFVVAYFLILLLVAWRTGKNTNNESFFIGNKSSNWMLVAFGMVGTSLSGVTFVSVPGGVGASSFAYFQITLGYLIGYLVIAYVLLPLYYKLNLTSIYKYLSDRFGDVSYKTGASFFILSRTLGATARLYLVVNILQVSILNSFNVPFWVTTAVILLMILMYTYKGGVKTIVWTDTLQTVCMLAGLVICAIYILNNMGLSFGEAVNQLELKGLSTVFNTDPNSKLFFVKQIVAGAFITITMTGLDQEMMQKNISVKTLKDSQKNMITLSVILLGVILTFLFLGGLLHLFAEANSINAAGDQLFPEIAIHHMPPIIGVIFIIALISALFPSADGAITALTSSICIDILNIKTRPELSDKQQQTIRQRVHLTMAVVFLVFVLVFKAIDNKSMIDIILLIAAYTYGPLLGLFAFGILTKRKVNEKFVPIVCILAPIICYILSYYSKDILGNFEIGLELIIINGLLTYLGLLAISYPPQTIEK